MERKIGFSISVVNDGDEIKDASFEFDSETRDDAVKLFITSFAATFEHAIKTGEDRTELGTLATMILIALIRGSQELSIEEEVQVQTKGKMKGEKKDGKTTNNLN